MHKEFKVESCDVVWNMQKQCHEITIVSEQGDRIFITDLGKGYETKLRKARQERDIYYEALHLIMFRTGSLGGSQKELEKALESIYGICHKALDEGDNE